ncbi:hypothetical protein A2U01_0052260, partial [Trifolium medium]|nr:hypothetical protein [Trifolium medium]
SGRLLSTPVSLQLFHRQSLETPFGVVMLPAPPATGCADFTKGLLVRGRVRAGG